MKSLTATLLKKSVLAQWHKRWKDKKVNKKEQFGDELLFLRLGLISVNLFFVARLRGGCFCKYFFNLVSFFLGFFYRILFRLVLEKKEFVQRLEQRVFAMEYANHFP